MFLFQISRAHQGPLSLTSLHHLTPTDNFTTTVKCALSHFLASIISIWVWCLYVVRACVCVCMCVCVFALILITLGGIGVIFAHVVMTWFF